MKFNYAVEKKKFDNQWVNLKKEYEEAGMSEEAIQKIYEFDYEQFKKQRTFCRHNQYLETEVEGIGDTEESMNPLMLKYEEKFIVTAKEVYVESRFSWIEEIDNPELYDVIHEMKKEDIDLLTMLAIEGYTVTEIAKIQGIAQPTVTKKITRIKKYLKKFIKMAMD